MKQKINIYVMATVTGLLVASNAFAQGLYINVGGGYGWPAASNLYSAEDNTTTYSGSTTTFDYKRVKGSGSFGKGGQAGATIGYMCNSNIGAELSIGYLFGSKITSTYNEKDATSSDFTKEEYTLQGKMLRFIPSIKITTGKEKCHPYLRAGIVIGVGGKLIETDDYSEDINGNTFTENYEGKYSGGTSIGFAGGVGIDYMVSKSIGIFGEASLIAQSWAPKKYELTKYVSDGVDVLPDMTTNEKETEFVDSYSETYPQSGNNDDSPSKEIKIYMPYSSIGICVGVHILLGNSDSKKE